jgi:hypothetical protein
VALRADAGYFAGQLARAAHDAQISFAIGAKRIAPLWRLLAGIVVDDWRDAIDMDGAQVAVAEYCPDWWPANTALLVRRVLLDPAQVSADPRSRRRRTLHPDQRALPIPELARAGAIYAYSFIVTSLDVSGPDKAIAAEHWYRHRTTVENLFRDSKLGAALRHLPYPQVNLAWMWAALLAAGMAAWLHSVLVLVAPRLTLTAARVMEHTKKYAVGTFDGVPASQPFPPAYAGNMAPVGERRGIYIPDGYAVPCSMITVGRCQAISEPHRNPTDPDLRRRSHRKPTDETAFPGTRRHAC